MSKKSIYNNIDFVYKINKSRDLIEFDHKSLTIDFYTAAGSTDKGLRFAEERRMMAYCNYMKHTRYKERDCLKDINKVIWHDLSKESPPEEDFYLINETFDDGSEVISSAEWRFAFSKIGVCAYARTGDFVKDMYNSLEYQLSVPKDGFYDIYGGFVGDEDYCCRLLKHVTHWAYKPLTPSQMSKDNS